MLLIWIVGKCTFVTDVLYYPIEAFISINHALIYLNKWVRLGSKIQEQGWGRFCSYSWWGSKQVHLLESLCFSFVDTAGQNENAMRTTDLGKKMEDKETLRKGHQLLNSQTCQTASCFLFLFLVINQSSFAACKYLKEVMSFDLNLIPVWPGLSAGSKMAAGFTVSPCLCCLLHSSQETSRSTTNYFYKLDVKSFVFQSFMISNVYESRIISCMYNYKCIADVQKKVKRQELSIFSIFSHLIVMLNSIGYIYKDKEYVLCLLLSKKNGNRKWFKIINFDYLFCFEAYLF